jgi:3-oxoacyl-ACP reductase-like protein
MGGSCSIFRAKCIGGFREKNPFGISRVRWEDNIKMDFQGGGGMEWIVLSQGRKR